MTNALKRAEKRFAAISAALEGMYIVDLDNPELREAVADGIAREVPMDMQDAYSAADGAIAAIKSFGRGGVNE